MIFITRGRIVPGVHIIPYPDGQPLPSYRLVQPFAPPHGEHGPETRLTFPNSPVDRANLCGPMCPVCPLCGARLPLKTPGHSGHSGHNFQTSCHIFNRTKVVSTASTSIQAKSL